MIRGSLPLGEQLLPRPSEIWLPRAASLTKNDLQSSSGEFTS